MFVSNNGLFLFRYSLGISYDFNVVIFSFWWRGLELNQHSLRRRSYSPLSSPMLSLSILVGVAGFEPATTWTQTMHSTRLNYTPMADHKGFEPLLSDLESDVLPLTLMAYLVRLLYISSFSILFCIP